MKQFRRYTCILFAFCILCLGYVYIFNNFVNVHKPITTISSKSNHVSTTSLSDKSRSKPERKYDYPVVNCSNTKPPFYPFNGTGQTVSNLDDFDVDTFNSFCETKNDLVAVVPVFSAPENFERREAMRETVGKTCTQLRCKLFFIVGVSLNKTVYDKLKQEYTDRKDILIVDKVDTYRDLDNKVVARLDWLIRHCRRPRYVIHTNDDFYPNLKMIINQLHSIKSNKFILGFVLRNIPSYRQKSSKWFLTYAEYPYAVLPPFTAGPLYAFRNDQSAVLRQTVHAVEFIWLEDVWFTGHVRRGAGFEAIGLKNVFINMPGNLSSNTLTSLLKSYSGIHKVTAEEFYKIYDLITRSLILKSLFLHQNPMK